MHRFIILRKSLDEGELEEMHVFEHVSLAPSPHHQLLRYLQFLFHEFKQVKS